MMRVKSMNNCILVTARCRPPCRDREYLVIQNPCKRPYFDIIDSGFGKVEYWDDQANAPTDEYTNTVLVYTQIGAKLKIRYFDEGTKYKISSSRGWYNTSDFFYDDGTFDFTLFEAIVDIPIVITLSANYNSCLHRVAVKGYDLDASIFEYTTQDGEFHRDILYSSLSYKYSYRTDIVDMKVVQLQSNVTTMDYTFMGCTSMVTFGCDVEVTVNLDSVRGTWYNCSSLTSFPLINTSNVTSMYRTWYNCSSLTSFPLIDTSSVIGLLTETWYNCSSLTSFPLINTSGVTSMYRAWYNCSSLTSFPLINTSGVTDLSSAWSNCNSLTSFPLINTSGVTDLSSAWSNCSSLTSFPHIDTSSVTELFSTWYNCSSLTSFPHIDTSSVTNTSSAWSNCSSLPLGNCGACINGLKICNYLFEDGVSVPSGDGQNVSC